MPNNIFAEYIMAVSANSENKIEHLNQLNLILEKEPTYVRAL
jgi:hypothetical protein